ncbi:1-(5-phosphoribosyl)-5-[(5-phosphoribosylamino)methylideneamino] imidazole-4-carboxamide isomerase [Anaerobacterium chartisolvens]|uniref:1-(5-phosphoribosyl)-5-[(5-phosphoribosylamino)methylideneamino] imidazole-4-carboxamide isomerase n=1 Tax=Anaerobacterium chartisolvens TaxID=1297424 RepID=A0A369AIG9_9FIRM|nr:1-(5-phosphoribosyl)-5-[(5-phosphoribosylamino)methylideneamino]imidazole-4-carboxamide isomerase [Anaerobacterium chartisolvens]RCX08913.1 1-(5-phosphoribosyl)-5-[(5-phosphoribosylamino)methylideneamino] imidazole-4-carboxamide isomerase [Anaerobacterium chartisolvens]
MIIYPAVDIKDGKCVRLSQGRFNQMTVYSDNPADMASKWQAEGAEYLHVVDLDGARTGEPANIGVISEMASAAAIPVQVGGGIRSIETIEKILSKGISRVILGTSAVRNPELVKNAVNTFGNAIVIGIDAINGMVAIEGWEKTSEFTAVEFAKRMAGLGVKTIIYTDISKDGMLSGPNLNAMSEMLRESGIEVIASGGVGSLKDIEDLRNIGMPGAIVGKALYTGNVDLKRAIELAK